MEQSCSHHHSNVASHSSAKQLGAELRQKLEKWNKILENGEEYSSWASVTKAKQIQPGFMILPNFGVLQFYQHGPQLAARRTTS
jgi:hypothetical protein